MHTVMCLQHFCKIQIKDLAGTAALLRLTSDGNQGSVCQVEAGACPLLAPGQVRNKDSQTECQDMGTRSLDPLKSTNIDVGPVKPDS